MASLKKTTLYYFLITLVVFLSGCGNDENLTDLHFQVIQQTSGHCEYTIGTAPVKTLTNISRLEGEIGKVFTTDEILPLKDITKLQEFKSFKPIELLYTRSGNTLYWQDYSSLLAASAYYALEQGFVLSKELGIDMKEIVSDLSETKILIYPKIVSGSKEMSDNAAYLGLGDSNKLLNYFLIFRHEKIKDVPTGLNLGVMVHEFTHIVNSHLARKKLAVKKYVNEVQAINVYGSIDEGFADYMGFIATQDANFLGCTFPSLSEIRNLSVGKSFNDKVSGGNKSVKELIEQDGEFDEHIGGAVFASIQYEIGQKLNEGHKKNARALFKMMRGLSECSNLKSSSSDSFDLTLQSIYQCHLASSEDTELSKAISDVYGKRLGTK